MSGIDDCPHPIEACTDGRCHMCGWIYDTPVPALDRRMCLRDVLVPLYREAPLAVANLCDEVLDRSGRLLGEVRIEARA
jgi:hypothetical protein